MGYITLAGSSFVNYGLTIRGFTPDTVDTTVSVLDQEFHSADYMTGLGVGSATTMAETFRESWTGSGGLTQTTLDGGATAALDYPGLHEYSDLTLSLGPRLFYTFEEFSGTANGGYVWTDHSGNNTPATAFSGTMVAAPGPVAYANGVQVALTAGTADINYWDILSNFDVTNLPSTAITVNIWFKTDTMWNWHNLILHDWAGGGSSTAVYSWGLYLSNTSVSFGLWQGGGTAGTAQYSANYAIAYNDNQWHMYTGVYDGTDLKVYVDGVARGTAAVSGKTLDNAGGIAVGGETSGTSLVRTLGPVSLFPTALAGTTIANLYTVSQRTTGYSQSTLDLLNQNALDGGTYIVNDVDGSHNNGILMTNVGTSGVYSESRVITDNLTAAPFDGAGTYYIQMPVWGFPPSSTADLANCYVTFSSSETYGTANTVTIPFNSGSVLTGTATIAAGGDFTWKINRDVLSNAGVDVTNLKRVKIGMKSLTGTFNFKAEGLKLVPSTYAHYKVGVNTKTGRLKQERWPGISQSDMPALLQNNFKAQDYTYVVKFSSGTLPGTPNNNEFSIYTRVNPDRAGQPNSYQKIRMLSNSVNTTVEVYEGTALLFSQVSANLTANKDHVMLIKLDDSKLRTEIWELDSFRLKSLKLDTNIRATSIIQEGYVGYEFKPYYGDFYLDYMYSKDIAVAEYESKTFESVTPVKAISFYPSNSTYTNLISSTLEESQAVDNLVRNITESGQHNINVSEVLPGINDVYVTTDTTVSVNGMSYKVQKDLKNAYIASMRYPSTFVANDLSFVTVTGYLRYESAYELTKKSDGSNGAFRIVLWDKFYQKPLYIGDIQDTSANKWNYFEVPVIADIYENEMNFEIQHCGTASTNKTAAFWVEDLEIQYKSIAWEASNNGGKSWIKLYDNINDPYKVINFPNDVYDHLVKNNNVAMYWKLDEIGGAIALDSSSNANNGVYAGTANITYAVSGTEILKTDPSNTAIRLTAGGSVYNSNPTGLSTAALTVNTWIRTGTALAQNIVTQSGTATGTWKLQTTPTGVKFDIYNSGTVLLSASATFNYYDDTETVGVVAGTPSWHNLTATYNRQYASLYIDGQLKATAYGTVPLLTGTAVSIEGPSSGYRYQDEVELYSTCLTEQEIVRLYNSGISTYNKLKIRARAYTADSWIGGYQLIPYYAKPGRYLEAPPRYINPNSIDSSEAFDSITMTRTLSISIGTANAIASAESVSQPSVFKRGIYPDSINSSEDVRQPTVSVATGMPAFRAATYTEGYSGSSLGIGTPTGATTGDVIVAVLGIRDNSNVIPSITWPAGWTEIEDLDFNPTGTIDRNYSVAWRVYNSGSAMGSASWSGGAPTSVSIGVAAYSGASTIHAYGTTVTNSGASGTSVTPGTVVTTVNNTRIVMAGYINDAFSVTNPAGYTTRQHVVNSFIADGSATSAGTVSGLTWIHGYADSAAKLLAVK